MGMTTWSQTTQWVRHRGVRLRRGYDNMESDYAVGKTPWSQTTQGHDNVESDYTVGMTMWSQSTQWV